MDHTLIYPNKPANFCIRRVSSVDNKATGAAASKFYARFGGLGKGNGKGKVDLLSLLVYMPSVCQFRCFETTLAVEIASGMASSAGTAC